MFFHPCLKAALLSATAIMITITSAQAITRAQQRAIRHLAAIHAATLGPPTAIRQNNLGRTISVVFTLPNKALKVFFIMPNGRLDSTSFVPVRGASDDQAAAAPAPAPAPAPSTPGTTPSGGECND